MHDMINDMNYVNRMINNARAMKLHTSYVCTKNISAHQHQCTAKGSLHMYVYIYIYAYAYVCIYIYIYMYVYTSITVISMLSRANWKQRL